MLESITPKRFHNVVVIGPTGGPYRISIPLTILSASLRVKLPVIRADASIGVRSVGAITTCLSKSLDLIPIQPSDRILQSFLNQTANEASPQTDKMYAVTAA